MKLIDLAFEAGTEPTMRFYCHCWHLMPGKWRDDKRLAVRGQAMSYGDICERVIAAGWVVGEPNVDEHGARHVSAFCSRGCHNEYVMHIHRSGKFRRDWWSEIRALEGTHHPEDMPPCNCTITEKDDGLLQMKSDPACPWHKWQRQYIDQANAREHALLDKWKDVAIGTTVRCVSPSQWRLNVPTERIGKIVGSPFLFSWTFGGACSAMVPVDDWKPHPLLSQLSIVEEEPKCACGASASVRRGARRTKTFRASICTS